MRFALIVRVFILILGLCGLNQRMGGAENRISDWAPIAGKNKDLTVLIRVEVEGKPPGYGSGVIIRPGHILTARHILPDSSILEDGNGNFLIKGLVGWDDPSIDFSGARQLEVEYISNHHDFALLRYKTVHPSKRYAFTGDKPTLGESLLVMGYPDGGSLTCTSGIASKKAEDGKFATDAAVGIGNSGGPVFASSGSLVGILLEGSGRDNNGRIALGYFLTAETVGRELSDLRADVRLTATPPPAEPVPNIDKITFAYSVDDEKTDHTGAMATEKSSELPFQALAGFRITSAKFQSTSANHVSNGPDVQIADDGSRVTLRYALQSGPIFDQWRGWIVGSVSTTQQRK